MTLIDATFLQFDDNQNLLEKYDSTYAKFEANQWILHNVWADMEGKSREYLETHKIETNSNELLMFENAIKNSNQSIWTILGVIKKLNLKFFIIFMYFTKSPPWGGVAPPRRGRA